MRVCLGFLKLLWGDFCSKISARILLEIEIYLSFFLSLSISLLVYLFIYLIDCLYLSLHFFSKLYS